jgi:hypothetical protein
LVGTVLTEYRNRVRAELKDPLNRLVIGRESNNEVVDLKPYEDLLKELLDGIEREIRLWLAKFFKAPL